MKNKRNELIILNVNSSKELPIIKNFKKFLKFKSIFRFKNFYSFNKNQSLFKTKTFIKLEKTKKFKVVPSNNSIEFNNTNVLKKYANKVLSCTRVTKVTPGFKKYTMRVILVMGNRAGAVGLGIGRGFNPDMAINKAINAAYNKIIYVPRTKFLSIPCKTENRVATSFIKLYPTSYRAGLLVGGSSRIIAELAGIANIMGLTIGSRNILNCAYATMNALNSLKLNMACHSKSYFRDKVHFNNILLKEAPIYL